MAAWLGIDFSGSAAKWAPGCTTSNVWIARLDRSNGLPIVSFLERVQDVPGSGLPFDRLGDWTRNEQLLAVGIDAPFSLPARHLSEDGGRDALLAAVAAMPCDGRPFPHGRQLVDFAEKIAPLAEAKPLRVTERQWRARGVTVRSTLWNGRGRPGAPFTVACLRFIAATGLPCWPWRTNGQPLLVEAFPAAQLRHWAIPAQGYNQSEEGREAVLGAIADRVRIPGPHLERARSNADALDAILCAFAAMAVTEGRLACALPDEPSDEGWIAVHA